MPSRPNAKKNGKTSLRLLKVIVQPVYVEDDGERLSEHVAQPVPVPASQWPDFPEQLEKRLPELEEQLAAVKNGGGLKAELKDA